MTNNNSKAWLAGMISVLVLLITNIGGMAFTYGQLNKTVEYSDRRVVTLESAIVDNQKQIATLTQAVVSNTKDVDRLTELIMNLISK